MTSRRKEKSRKGRVGGSAAWLAAAAIATSPLNANGQASAKFARALSGTDTTHLHLVRSGETLLEEGPTSGALPGRMRAELHIGPTFTGNFTIYTSGGSISGSGVASPHGSGRYQSFAGTLTVTGGSGIYAHVHGRNGLYGVFDRRTYAAVVTTTGTLSY
jgi:hypothetical protein